MSEFDTKRLGGSAGRWIVPLAVTLSALTCASIAQMVEKHPALRFAGGKEERILAVTYGKTHRWRRRETAAEWLSPVLGKSDDGLIKWDSPTSVLVIWPERRATVNLTQYGLRDEHGCLFKPGPGWFKPTDPTELSNLQKGISDPDAEVFRDFPRSSKKLMLEARRADRQLAYVELPNPVPEEAPSFSGPALPVEGKVDNLSVTVKRILPSRLALGGSEIELEVRENGKLTNGWSVVRYAIQDATGNRLQGDPSLDSGSNLFGIVNLCARVPWRLRLDLLPVVSPARAPDHLVVLPIRSLPRKGESVEAQSVTQVGDLRFHLNRISWERIWDDIPTHPSAWVTIGNCHDPLILAADPKVDRKGKTRWGADFVIDSYRSSNRRHQPYPASVWLFRDPEDYVFPLSRHDVKSQTLRIGVYLPRTVELTFTPQP